MTSALRCGLWLWLGRDLRSCGAGRPRAPLLHEQTDIGSLHRRRDHGAATRVRSHTLMGMPEKSKSVRDAIGELFTHEVLTRADLVAQGMSTHQITAAVRERRLLRARRGVYVRPGMPPQVLAAVRIGGRLTCLSLLEVIGIFVHSRPALHVCVPAHLSRSRGRRPKNAILHWGGRAESWHDHVVSLGEAIRQSVLCQDPRATIATLDSLLHHRVIDRDGLVELLAGLPKRFQTLIALVDGSAESGPETYMRLILRSLGVRFECQVQVEGVGRVDFLVEGWLIIECDSKRFHEGWDKQVEDRARDLAAAKLGFVTIRPLASDLLFDRTQVRAQVQAVVAAFSTRLARSSVPQLRRTGRDSASLRRYTTSLL